MGTLAREVPAAKPKGVTRRRLLIAAGAGAGIAVGWAVWPRGPLAGWTAGKGEHVVNAFVKIGPDGRVVVAVPQAEMGQGVSTSLPQILADELGADWNAVGVEPAPLAAAYANHGMLIDQTASLSGVAQQMARWAGGKVVDHFDVQMTGGSTSVRGFEMPMRQAGAAAREMLCRAAARQWNVDWRECDTRDSFVIHQAKRLPFGAVAEAATMEDAPKAPVLRDAKSRPLIGKPLQRIDIPSKTDGSARFGIDVRLPGMMYAAVEAGPIGATRKSVGKAKLPAGARVVEGPGFTAVVADGWYAAKTALATLDIVYTPAAKPAGPWIEAGLKAALAGDGKVVETKGDVDAGLNGAGAITADYTLPFLHHATLEPVNATARVENGKAEVWGPFQSTTLIQWAVAKALGIADADVTVFPTLVGGGFGRKAESDAAVKAALIAKAVARPVQLIYSREEDMSHGMWRPPVAARFRGRVEGGKVVAWDARVAAPDPAASFMARNIPAIASDPKPNAAAIEGVPGLPYDFGAVRVAHFIAENPVPLGFWRSVGHSFSAFLVESFIDELAHSASIDPGEFRLSLLKNAPRHASVLRAALKAGGPLGQIEPGVARGCALAESFGSIVAQVAEVSAKPGEPLKVTRVTAAIDCGRTINPDIIRAQIEGGILFGLTAALHGRSTFKDGESEQRNFDGYPLLTLAETPQIDVVIIPSTEGPGGVGEPGTPPIAPAVANAIFAASGKRLRDLPFAWT